MLITPNYKKILKQDHEQNPNWGTTGARYVDTIKKLCIENNTLDVLDYGAGKGRLGDALGFPIKEYDPGVEGKDSIPEASDIVISTDALEHIEPQCIRAVLEHIRSLTKVIGFHAISTTKAHHRLPNGKNAHLIVQGADWWKMALEIANFEVEEIKLDCNAPRYDQVCYTVIVR